MGVPDLIAPDDALVALIRARLDTGNARADAAPCSPSAAERAAAADDAERVRQAALDAFFGRGRAA